MSFGEYTGLANTPASHTTNNIPFFELYSTVTDNYEKDEKTNKIGIINRAISFNKVENNKYLREYRYDVEGLSTLSQIASVYNATVTSFPMLSMFPGMLFYAGAGLYQDAQTYNSIAHILGLGGYHVTTAVSHDFPLDNTGIVKNGRSTIEGVWTFAGTIKGKPETDSIEEEEEDVDSIEEEHTAYDDSDGTEETEEAEEEPTTEKPPEKPTKKIITVIPEGVISGDAADD